MEGRRASWGRAALATGVMGVLSSVVVVGAGGLGASDATSPFVRVDSSDVFDVVVVLLAAMAMWAFYDLLLMRHVRVRRRGPQERLQPWHVLGAILVVAAVVVGFRELLPVDGEDAPPTSVSVTGSIVDRSADDPVAAEPSPPGWELWLIAGVGVAALVLLATTRSRVLATADPRDVEPTAEPVVGAPVESADRDPRSRVFDAYRRVESLAGDAGVGRPIGETVHAHLRRVGETTRPTPANVLAVTYDVARFSPVRPHEAEIEAAERASRDLSEELE